ncbi:MAG TPA: glycosyltransferase family 9 protein [Patescibacteria group bacterium]|nr:glycosyltransferase family 9 protein [Patescibacteria group bacterium]
MPDISPQKILVIRLSSMGDIVLTTAFVRQLRAQFPQAEIHFLVGKRFKEILECNPHISKIIEYDHSLQRQEILVFKKDFVKTLSFKKYDVVIDLQRNLRSWEFRRGLAKKVLKVEKARFEKIALVRFKKNFFKNTTIAERYRRTAAELDIQDDGRGLELWLPEERKGEKGIGRTKHRKENYPPESKPHHVLRITHYASRVTRIAIAPGAHHFTKRWPLEKFAELAEMLFKKYSCEIVLLGSVADKEICRKISEKLSFIAIDRSDATSVFDTARELDACDVLITNDTGVMHIAAARRIPVVAIFGSTVTAFGFAPFRVENRIVEVSDLPCRPCTHIGRAECPLGHFNCMNLIAPDTVLKSVEELFLKNIDF